MADDDDDEENEDGEGEAAPLHGDVDGNTPEGTARVITDCPWLLVLILALCGLHAVSSYAQQAGDLRRLAGLPASDGRICGTEGTGDYLYFCNSGRRACVEACPTDVDVGVPTYMVCDGGPDYPSRPFAGLLCVPTNAGPGALVVAQNYTAHEIQISEVVHAWQPLLAAAVVAVVLAMAYLCLLETFALCMVWLGSFFLVMASGAFGVYSIHAALSAGADGIEGSGDSQLDLAVGLGACCVSFLLLCLVCCKMEQIETASGCIKEACECIVDTPALVLEPILALAWRAAVLLPMLSGFLLLLSCGRSRLPDGSVPLDGAQPFLRFSGTEWLYVAFYAFMLIWVSELCHALSLFAVAYVVELWYFRDRDAVRKEDACLSRLREAYCVALRHHLGTLCCGSFLIAVLRPFRVAAGFLAGLTEDTDNPLGACLAEICLCVVMCYKRWLEYVNKNAYPDVAMNSIGFCRAAQHALEVLSHESVEEAALQSISWLLQLTGLGSISAAGAVTTWAIVTNLPQYCEPESEQYVEEPVNLVVLAGVVSFLVAWPFVHIFDTVADTVLYCTAVDEMRRTPEEEEEEDEGGCMGWDRLRRFLGGDMLPPEARALLGGGKDDDDDDD